MDCPICNKRLEEKGDNEENSTWCTNKCYYEEFAYGAYKTEIFGKATFYASYNFNEKQWKEYHDDIQEKIDFWKQNDKYLMEIIENTSTSSVNKIGYPPTIIVSRRYQRVMKFNEHKKVDSEDLF